MNRPWHIFIVEDNEKYSMMLDYVLSKDNNYRFIRLSSGEDCIKNLHLDPDIIILDYGLPGMNGYETLLNIKTIKPNVHVITLTNNTDHILEVKLKAAGSDHHVFKQGHGERQVIEKVEHFINEKERAAFEEVEEMKRTRIKKLAVLVGMMVLATLGCYLIF
ncbi:MAG TPA: response regulator [Bacteroidia bacterium]|jgi:DNA-binding response OmpR family regulator